MLFQTWSFLIFFLIAYPLYLLAKGTRLRLPWLLATSYVFYAWLDWRYLFPIAYVSVVDYLVVARMARSERKRRWLWVSIANNLVVLGLFKYGQFATDNVNALLSALNVPYLLSAPGILLPAGLSFYLFQSMGYVIDSYRGTIERETSFVRYATFVAFFPRLLAGPIERAGNLLPQLRQTPKITASDFSDGLSLFVVGLFKKVALANYLALYVNKVYAAPGDVQAPALILATFLFAWQIYFDFSGYTDMARGIAAMMGLRLMLNFNNPYLATSLGAFWNRWHISLSSWFKDYVYIPLGGNRKGRFNTYRNIFVTMVLSGLWHGAAWTFVLWGAVHALGRFATRELERTAFYRDGVPAFMKQAFVFAIVTFAWIFFRAETVADARQIVIRIFSSGITDPRCPLLAILLIAAVWCYQYVFESRLRWALEYKAVRMGLVVLMLAYLALFAPSGEQPFIYMQF
ncbi:MAG: MBOAT family O-acyltransferase [Sedimentisphaerales bacterium]|jgi:D-alanyl-lipoteichoic acid acyltransferase DltB (MBOAT superfamily)|nr:MBOAT family O-acyltransferase [Sedimentisphaerales bacterium]NLT75287.1 MBOAT family protein [Planctomycetota bacterium]